MKCAAIERECGSFFAGTPAEAKGPVCVDSESITYKPDGHLVPFRFRDDMFSKRLN